MLTYAETGRSTQYQASQGMREMAVSAPRAVPASPLLAAWEKAIQNGQPTLAGRIRACMADELEPLAADDAECF